MRVCLVGNPNCGKTTLFNYLTHSYQKVGNWAGVTVDSKVGDLFYDRSVKVVDLPGLYSLSPTSPDEKVVVDYLKNNALDLIVNVIDGTNLERGLYLTLSLIKLNLPMLVAVNMADELRKNDISLNVKKLKEFLGVPVVLISARAKEGLKELEGFFKVENTRSKNKKLVSLSFAQIHNEIEKEIDKIIQKKITLTQKNTEKIDKVLTHGFWGFFIFILVMTIVFSFTLKLGGYLGDELIGVIGKISDLTANFALKKGVNFATVSLLVDGVFKGIGSVLSFLPHLLIMFSFMTFLEESGYTARVSFLFDKIFSRFNLSGKSVIPFVLSFGCSVSGIEASKVIENRKEREATIMLAPFIPCGAKMAILGWFSYRFLGGSVLLALLSYFISIVILFLVAKIFKKFDKGENSEGFILELPVLRLPRLKNILSVLFIKTKEFLIKSGTVIFAVSIVVWLLSNFGPNGITYKNAENSFLRLLGEGLKYLFYPLGFSSWESCVSVLSGLLAKESIVETLEILSVDFDSLFSSPYKAFSFMAFNLFCPPCVATLAIAKRELKSVKKLFKMIGVEFAVAYLVSFGINLIGIIISLDIGLILSIFIGIILLVGFAFAIKRIGKGDCQDCKKCRKVNCEIQNHVRLYERIGNGARRRVFSRRVDGREKTNL
ncbi:MAG: ferrous iron transporter B [Clostridia bacterium]|nr:ferrous iron transporter B [Clostridia bacterium]